MDQSGSSGNRKRISAENPFPGAFPRFSPATDVFRTSTHCQEHYSVEKTPMSTQKREYVPNFPKFSHFTKETAFLCSKTVFLPMFLSFGSSRQTLSWPIKKACFKHAFFILFHRIVNLSGFQGLALDSRQLGYCHKLISLCLELVNGLQCRGDTAGF